MGAILDHFQPVGFQRRTGFHNIHNSVGKAHDGSQFHRSLDFDNIDIHAFLIEKCPGHIGVFTGNHSCMVATVKVCPFRGSQSKFTPSESQIQHFIEGVPLFQDGILPTMPKSHTPCST